MKMLSGSHMNNYGSNKEPILPCLLLLNKMFADSSSVHGTLALLLFSYLSVVRVKGIMTIYDGLSEMRETGMNSTCSVFVNMFNLLSMIQPIMIKHVCNDN